MASAHPLFCPPASRLNDDTLYHIFFINTLRDLKLSEDYPADEEIHNMPSTVTRRSSQVCKQWRRVLLRASVIWGRCIDVDILGISMAWRDEVLKRAGNSPLAIRHQSQARSYVGDKYLAQLLAETWPRVIYLEIPYDGPHFKQLQLPAPSMETFIIRRTVYGMAEQMSVPLFQGYAPKLINIRIPPSSIKYDGVVMWKSLTFFTSNMRHLSVDNKSDIPPSILLSACMRMPLLETLSADICQEDDPPPDFPPAQQVVLAMNHLTVMNISSPTFDVYHTFLARISTAPGCSLIIQHLVPSSGLHKFVRYTDIMAQVFARFSESLYDHHPRTAESDKVTLDIEDSGPVFTIYDRKMCLYIGKDDASNYAGLEINPVYIPVFIDAFLAVKMPSDSMNIRLDGIPDRYHKRWLNSLPKQMRSQLKTSFHRLLGPGSMPWATSITLRVDTIFFIHKMDEEGTAFPNLQHLRVHGPGHMRMDTVILPFVANRRKTMIAVTIHTLPESPARHVIAFGRERLPEELVFVWNESERWSVADYVEQEHLDDETVESDNHSTSSSAYSEYSGSAYFDSEADTDER